MHRASILIALFATSVATADERAVNTCLVRQMISNGLESDADFETGGESDVFISFEHATSTWRIFSPRGVATVVHPWPKTQRQITIAAPGETQRVAVTWTRNGTSGSQSTASPKAKADVVADRYAPLDDGARKIVERLVRHSMPRTLKSLEDDRAYDSKRHMPFSPAIGHEESYRACQSLGIVGLDSFVDAEYGKWKTLATTKLEWDRYELVRRADHPEWRACKKTADCQVTSGACGWPDVIAKSAAGAYVAWAKTRSDQINCDRPDDEPTRAVCQAGQCVDPTAVPHDAWVTCKADADCTVEMACATPVATNNKGQDNVGFARWSWWQTVDNWDQCSGATPAPPKNTTARCTSGRCTLSP